MARGLRQRLVAAYAKAPQGSVPAVARTAGWAFRRRASYRAMATEQMTALMGAELLFYPTAIGSEPYDADLDTSRMWRRAMQGHAVSNCMPVIAAYRIGAEGDANFYGHSFITDEWGDLTQAFGAAETGVLVETIDLDRAAKHRAGMGFFRDRRPQLYGRLAEDI